MPSTLRSSKATDARPACRSSAAMCSRCSHARRSMPRYSTRRSPTAPCTCLAGFVSCERIAGGWTLNTTAGPVTGSWLLGADGASGIVRKRVFRPFARRQLSIAAGFVRGERNGGRDRDPLRRSARAGISGPFRVAIISRLARARRLTRRPPRNCTRLSTAGSIRTAAGARATETPIRVAHPVAVGADLDAERPAGDRWMLLGDAAGLVDPITREGIFFALRSGSLAAAALAGIRSVARRTATRSATRSIPRSSGPIACEARSFSLASSVS